MQPGVTRIPASIMTVNLRAGSGGIAGQLTYSACKLVDHLRLEWGRFTGAEVRVRISKPGTYHLDKLRLSYWTNGSRGWQYEYLKITYKISNPPLPGQRPLPKSAVCDKP